MEARVDSGGRIVVPKPMREALGLVPGSVVDITPYGAGLAIIPGGRTAKLVEVDGVLVGTSETVIDDEVVFALIDAGRK
jgi:AbrB family looped-hinge helix DNA binding protein